MHDFIFAVDEPLLQGGNITFVKNIGETSQFSGSPTMVGLGGAFPEHKDLTAIFCFACVCVLLITGSSTNELSDLLLFP